MPIKNYFKGRAVNAVDIEWNFYELYQNRGLEISYPNLYKSDTETYLVYTLRAKLYKVVVNVKDGIVEYSDPQEVVVEHMTISRDNIFIERTDEGLKFAGIAGSATINRSLEIDTKSLFDSFVENFDEKDVYRVNFYHVRDDEDFQMGYVKKIERSGNLLLVYGIIDEETLFGRDASKNFSRDDVNWGFSIEFIPFEKEVLDVDGIKLNSYTKGKFHGIAVLLEEDASHYFTTVIT